MIPSLKSSGHISTNVYRPFNEDFLDKWKNFLFDYVGYAPHEGQRRLHFSRARFRAAVCGRRWGKSTFAAMETLYYASFPDVRAWVVAPTYDLSDKVYRLVLHHGLNCFGKPTINSKTDKTSRWEWHNNYISEVRSKSANNEVSLKAEGLDLVVIDEAAWSKIKTIWEGNIRAALTDRRGKALIITTPNGYNEFYDLFTDWETRMRDGDPDYFVTHEPSWNNNYVYPLGREDPEIISVENSTDEQYFMQEYAAEFTSMQGRVYKEWRRADHISETAVYKEDVPVFLGWDFGYRHPAILACHINFRDRTVVIFDELWTENTTIDECIMWVKNRSWFKDLAMIHPDPAGNASDSEGQTDISRLKKYGLTRIKFPTSAHDREIMGGVHRVRMLLKKDLDGRPHLLVNPRCEGFIRSIENYMFPESPGANLPEKDGIHDHMMDALRYLVVCEFPYDVTNPVVFKDVPRI